jgi:hypothetical protein
MNTVTQLDREIAAAARQLALASHTNCPVAIEFARLKLEQLIQKQRQLPTSQPK